MTTTPTIVFDTTTLCLRMVDAAELVGSPKQIEWATDIRAGMFRLQIGDRFDRARVGATPEQIAVAIAKISEGSAPLLAITSAKFWIDNRGSDWQILAGQVARKEI